MKQNDFFKNPDTGDIVFYHGSKTGIVGQITPDKSHGTTDFGNGFYLGTRKIQTLSRVSQEKAPFEYDFAISSEYINDENTLKLNDEDWMYFVLFNCGKLEPLKGTQFYKHYESLADGKDFIIGPIADDIFDKCIMDFCENNITDYTYINLINMFDYGTQVVAKSQRACDVLQLLSQSEITKEQRKEIISNRKYSKKERFALYEQRKSELNVERKGKYLTEIIKELKENGEGV